MKSTVVENAETPDYIPVKRRRNFPYPSSTRNNNVERDNSFTSYKEIGSSLLLKSLEGSRKSQTSTNSQKIAETEATLLKAVLTKKGLRSATELASGLKYESSMQTGWTDSSSFEEKKCHGIRSKLCMSVEGNLVPMPSCSFLTMGLPNKILHTLRQKGIMKPTAIQMQGIPLILSGRDMIGIASTGSGKTLAFVLPILTSVMIEQLRMPLVRGEGPLSLIICPSRELARQTHEVLLLYSQKRPKEKKSESISVILCIGGLNVQEVMREPGFEGVHVLTATPGRLRDMLSRRDLNLDICRLICLDEADRMVDLGFEDEIQEIFSYFKTQRQTILFSATMPFKIKKFAESNLVNPVTINIGRAGAANLDVIQDVECVEDGEKLTHILKSLTKSAPPVLIFCENKRDVDKVHEYLLLKGIDAVSIHGGKDQSERNKSIEQFKHFLKDVLVATDVISKGLDFPAINHVINFDMPAEIENYVHRIGRTGRGGKTGIATTLITPNQSEVVLKDLQHLLVEAKQKVPEFLSFATEKLVEEDKELVALTGVRGCAYCGGLGHRIGACPKLDSLNAKVAFKTNSPFGSSECFGGEL